MPSRGPPVLLGLARTGGWPSVLVRGWPGLDEDRLGVSPAKSPSKGRTEAKNVRRAQL